MKLPRPIRVADVVPRRWRNGGGWTRELLVSPGTTDWRVRVSVADIEADGPFSSFPGVRRFFAVLHGAGVELVVDGRTHRVEPSGAALQFAGDATTRCRLLDGPTRDLNLMLREPGTGALARVLPGETWRPPTATCGLFALAAGQCRSDEGAMNVPGDCLVWFEHAPVSLAFDASGWWVAA